MSALDAGDFAALWLSLKLAGVVTVLLLVLSTPIAWWLSRSRSRLRDPIAALITLPLILPPTVLGFYLLLAMGPDGPIGKVVAFFGLSPLPFSFAGLVVGSFFYSLPFVVQPIQNALEAVGQRPLEVAATLRAGPVDRFFTVLLPLARPGFVTAAVLGFAHTLGEFGVVLMIGGNIPGATQVLSVQLYDHVEALDYARAHRLAALMLGFSFAMMLVLQWLRRRNAATTDLGY
ncbi:molybdate ABC transporter permease subunit [Spongiibacter sp. KMU-166]|uniref:Molybdenum transport system permease n=1 Tax=Spongiibacter thalassae TaxID=2721624 RepID=A0ABX1GED0_9GAMM|nr:molybdate ABC transporter permease subunit [Spongiibacter thalassae]NKI17511.1 molybdate ABC transporter permease subunit [Spongiibacter thalassae]